VYDASWHLLGQFNRIVSHLDEHDGLESGRLDDRLLIALDGIDICTWTDRSEKNVRNATRPC